MAGLESRPSRHPTARRTGTGSEPSRGESIIVRSNRDWTGIAEVAVTPEMARGNPTGTTCGIGSRTGTAMHYGSGAKEFRNSFKVAASYSCYTRRLE